MSNNKEITSTPTPAQDLYADIGQLISDEFGKGFTYSLLTRMVKFYKACPEKQIITTLSQQLSWSHFVELLKLKSDIQREFRGSEAKTGGWG